jgi:hypothetical protein
MKTLLRCDQQPAKHPLPSSSIWSPRRPISGLRFPAQVSSFRPGFSPPLRALRELRVSPILTHADLRFTLK